MEYTLHLGDEATPEIVKGIIAPLVVYNTAQAGPSGGRPVVIALRNEAGEVVGGLSGSTGFQWLFTQFLAVPEALRGQGIGSRLMRMAEAEAVARGCHGAWLDTFDFQARGFYEKLGYTCFGELSDYPVGHARFFMKKALAAVPASTKTALPAEGER